MSKVTPNRKLKSTPLQASKNAIQKWNKWPSAKDLYVKTLASLPFLRILAVCLLQRVKSRQLRFRHFAPIFKNWGKVEFAAIKMACSSTGSEVYIQFVLFSMVISPHVPFQELSSPQQKQTDALLLKPHKVGRHPQGMKTNAVFFWKNNPPQSLV